MNFCTRFYVVVSLFATDSKLLIETKMKTALKMERYLMYQSIWNEYIINTGALGTLTDVYLHLKLHCTDNHIWHI